MNTFLVTGANGVLAGALIERLLDRGYKVIGLDKKEKGSLSGDILVNKNFTFIKADITNNFGHLLNGAHVDGIFHLASQLPLSNDLTYIDFYKGNVETALSVLDFAKIAKPKFIVYTSTGSVFGKNPGRKYVDEKSVPTPTSYYGLTKLIPERLLEIGLRDTQTKGVVIRYPSIFSKNHSYGVVSVYYELACKGKDIEVYGRGKKYRNFLYIEDAVGILLKVIDNFDKLDTFDVFMAGSSDSITLARLARMIKKLLKSDSRLIFSDNIASTDWDVFIDISKARKTLKFNPIAVEEGMRRYIEEKRI